VRRRSTVRAPNPDPCNGLHGNLVLGVLLQSPRNVTDFNAFGAFKTSKFRYILGWCGFRKILSETKVRQNVGRTLVVYAPKVSHES
jgi:hypothetical protein